MRRPKGRAIAAARRAARRWRAAENRRNVDLQSFTRAPAATRPPASRRFLVLPCLALAASVIVFPPQNVPLAAPHPDSVVHDALAHAPLAPAFGRGSAQDDGAQDDAQAEAAPFGALALGAFEESLEPGVLRYGDVYIRLPFDEATGVYSFGPMRLRRDLVETILSAAFIAGVDPRLLMAIADKESSFAVAARASTSTATGLFQFIDATWLKALRDFGADFGLAQEAAAAGACLGQSADEATRARLLALRRDPFLSTLLAAAMLRREQEKLEAKMGRAITEAEVYLVHFLGPAGAEKFLAVLAGAPTSSAARLLPAAARANKPIFFEARLVEAKTKAKAKGNAKKTATRLKRAPQSLSVVEVHGKIGASLERRLARYRDLDFGPGMDIPEPRDL